MKRLLSAQVDWREVRAGNRKFREADYRNAEIDYRRAVVKDSLSLAGEYNLASALYRQESWDEAGKALETVKDVAPGAVTPRITTITWGTWPCRRRITGRR